MVVKTIGVRVTGGDEVEAMSAKIQSLQKHAKQAILEIKGMGNKGKSPSLYFKVRVEIDRNNVIKQLSEIQKMINRRPLKIGVEADGINTSTKEMKEFNKELKSAQTTAQQLAKSSRGTFKVQASGTSSKQTGSNQVKDKVAKFIGLSTDGFKEIYGAADTATNAVKDFALQMSKLGVIDPTKRIAQNFKSIVSSVAGFDAKVAGAVGGKLNGLVGGAVSAVGSGARSGFGSLISETKHLGDAMEVFRVNMEALDFDPKDVNKAIKELGDYGKNTVYDASDLLEGAGQLFAFGHKDAVQIQKALAGLTAQTKDPVGNLREVNNQLGDMLAAEKLQLADLRIMRQRFNSIATSKINQSLSDLAKGKGYKNLGEALRKGGISSDEALKVFQEVGNQLQDLTTAIVTPSQALGNLKETLSNLLVYDDIDDEGNVKPGPLKGVYNETTNFIKGITKIVGSDKFKGYVKNFGDTVSSFIKGANKFGEEWKKTFGESFLKQVETFFSQLKSSLDFAPLKDSVNNLTQNIGSFGNRDRGAKVGQFLSTGASQVVQYGSNLVSLGSDFVDAGGLGAINEIIAMYVNLTNLAGRVGAPEALANHLNQLYSVINSTLTNEKNIESVKGVVDSLSTFLTSVINIANWLLNETNLVQGAGDMVKTLLNNLTLLTDSVKANVGTEGINKAVDNIKNAWSRLLEGIRPIMAKLLSGAINYLGSDAGKKTLDRIADLFTRMFTIIKQYFTTLGDGKLEKGIDNFINQILNVVDKALDGLQYIANNKFLVKSITKILAWSPLLKPVFDIIFGFLQGISNLIPLAKLIFKDIPTCIEDKRGGIKEKNVSVVKNATDYSGVDFAEAFGEAGEEAVGSYSRVAKNANRPGFFKGAFNSAKQRVNSFRYNRALAKGNFEKAGDLAEGLLNLKGSTFSNTKFASGFKGALSTFKEIKATSGLWKATGNLLKSGGLSAGKGLLKGGLGLAKGIGLAGGVSFGADLINNLVQNSRASQGVKDTSTVLSSAASWGATGASIGSIIPGLGTLAGGIIGTIGGGIAGFLEVDGKKQVAKETLGAIRQLGKDDTLTGGANGFKEKVTGILDTFRNAEKQLINNASEQAQAEINQWVGDLTGGNATEQNTAKESIRAILASEQGITDKKLQDLVIANLQKNGGNLQEAIDNARAQLEQEEGVIPQLQQQVTGFVDTVGQLVQQGVLPVEGARRLLVQAGINVEDVDTSQLSEAGTQLWEQVKDNVDGTTNKLVDTKESAKVDLNHDLTPVKSSAQNLGTLVKNLVDGIPKFLDSLWNSITEGAGNLWNFITGGWDWSKNKNIPTKKKLLKDNPYSYKPPKGIYGYATGGIIPAYHAVGDVVQGVNWQPKGTDTVPAMLTPGEYVIRKRAVDSLGKGFLDNLNRKGALALQNLGNSTIINNIYNTNNAKINQHIDNKSQYLNGMMGLDRMMRYV